MGDGYLATRADEPRTVLSTEVAQMKARILLAVVVLALASACSGGSVITAPEQPALDGVGAIGSGH